MFTCIIEHFCVTAAKNLCPCYLEQNSSVERDLQRSSDDRLKCARVTQDCCLISLYKKVANLSLGLAV